MRSNSNDSIKTSEVLHESVTKQATNKPKTNGATLCTPGLKVYLILSVTYLSIRLGCLVS